MINLSIVVPCYNEEDSISLFYNAMLALFNELPNYKFEVICIDDGSTDSSLDKLIALTHTDERFKVIEFSRNFGKEIAMTAGLDTAKGDAVIIMDIDLQTPPSYIPKFIEKWNMGYEVVAAKRVDRNTDSFLRKITSEAFYKVHNKLSSVKIPQNVGDFRLMDRVVVDAIKRLPESQRFMKGLYAWCGFKTAFIDFEVAPRLAGESKFHTWKLWNFAIEAITSFSIAPLTAWFYMGIITLFFAFLYSLYIILSVLFLGISAPGYASLMVMILFFGGMQFVGIGLLGEYIGRIYMESKNRPLYIVRKFHSK